MVGGFQVLHYILGPEIIVLFVISANAFLGKYYNLHFREPEGNEVQLGKELA